MTGIDVYLSVTATFVVCIFYTSAVSDFCNLKNSAEKKFVFHFLGRYESCYVDRHIASYNYVWLYVGGKDKLIKFILS